VKLLSVSESKKSVIDTDADTDADPDEMT